MKKLTVGSCFSGIGGLELGLEWTGGFETKWQIEIDPYATKVLEKHWPNVKRYSDIRDVVRPEPVELICGGFPCQDVSLAGKREGLKGKRSTLWSEMFRLVCEVKPRWVLVENVPGLLSSDGGRFFGRILRDLAFRCYDVEWRMFSASGVGAPHLRRRIFFVAYTESEQSRWIFKRRFRPDTGTSGQMADTPGTIKPRFGAKQDREQRRSANEGWWAVEPDVGRVAHGIPSRVDRLKCLGNAVVPQVAQKIGEMILNAM